MRLHISDEDFAELQAICHDWQRAKTDQADCVSAMIDLFGCHADEAVDLLTRHRSATEVVNANAIEVHNSLKCNVPWPHKIDGETCVIWLVITGGAVVASVSAMFG